MCATKSRRLVAIPRVADDRLKPMIPVMQTPRDLETDDDAERFRGGSQAGEA